MFNFSRYSQIFFLRGWTSNARRFWSLPVFTPLGKHPVSAIVHFSCSDRCVCKFNFKVYHKSWKELAIFCSRCYWWPAQIPWDPFYCPTAAAGAVANGSCLWLYPALALGPLELPHSFHPPSLGLKHTGVFTSSTGCYGVQKPSPPTSRQTFTMLQLIFLSSSGIRLRVTSPETTSSVGFSSCWVGSCSPHSLTMFSCEHHP